MSENSLCVCGIVETTKHFLLECPRFTQAKTALKDTFSPFCNPSLNVILYGDHRSDFRQNKLIFLTVQQYISELIVLGFNDTPTLVGHFVSSPREREKRDRRDSRRDERE